MVMLHTFALKGLCSQAAKTLAGSATRDVCGGRLLGKKGCEVVVNDSGRRKIRADTKSLAMGALRALPQYAFAKKKWRLRG